MWSLGALPDGEYVKYVLTSKEFFDTYSDDPYYRHN